MARLALRLRHVAQVGFNRSEMTNFLSLPASVRRRLKGNDAVAMVSKTGNQIVFVYAPKSHEKKTVFQSARLRIQGSSGWNPLMLANYAEAAGINLVGLKKFEEYYAK